MLARFCCPIAQIQFAPSHRYPPNAHIERRNRLIAGLEAPTHQNSGQVPHIVRQMAEIGTILGTMLDYFRSNSQKTSKLPHRHHLLHQREHSV